MTMQELLPWHSAQWEQLDQALRDGRLAHGLLLRGPAGLGKRRFADAIARRLLCEHMADPPCGQCKGCGLTASQNHPDFFVLTPDEDSRQIRIEQLRTLIGKLGLSSHMQGFKVVIIDPADAMNVNAQNSLLKTLEEPAEKTILMLVSSRPAALAATVLSRCQALEFRCPDREVALQWLATQGEGDWSAALNLAGGAPLAALELGGEGAAGLDAELAGDLAALMAGRSDPVSVAESWAREDLLLRLRWLQRQVYALTQWRLGAAPELVHRILLKSLQNEVPNTSVKSIYRYLDSLERVIGLSDRTVNMTLTILPLLTAWVDGPRFERITDEAL